MAIHFHTVHKYPQHHSTPLLPIYTCKGCRCHLASSDPTPTSNRPTMPQAALHHPEVFICVRSKRCLRLATQKEHWLSVLNAKKKSIMWKSEFCQYQTIPQNAHRGACGENGQIAPPNVGAKKCNRVVCPQRKNSWCYPPTPQYLQKVWRWQGGCMIRLSSLERTQVLAYIEEELLGQALLNNGGETPCWEK